MKKTCLFLVLAVLTLTLCGCGATVNYSYPDAGKYSVGEATVSGAVEKLDIDWIDGSVNLAYHKENTVEITETARKKLSDGEKLRWWLDGATLRIKYAQSGNLVTDNMEKALTVTLPEGITLKEAAISSVSGDIHSKPLYAEKAKLNTVSGTIDAECAADELEAGSVSGKIGLTASANEISLNTTSGEIKADIGHAEKAKVSGTSGDISLKAQEIKETDISTISGKAEVKLQKGESLKVSSVSGGVRVALPKDWGFTAETSTVSGSVRCELPVEKQGNRYVSGDGSMKVTIQTVSGGINLSEYK